MDQQTLCAAVRAKENVLIRHDDDMMERTFSPYIVYYSSQGNLTVAGYQMKNPAEPLERNEWCNFAVAKLKSVRTTGTIFRIDESFSPVDKLFGNCIVCHVMQSV